MMKIESIRIAAAAIGFAGALTVGTTAQPASASLAPLPESVTSFGAATDNDWLYAFGGHKHDPPVRHGG